MAKSAIVKSYDTDKGRVLIIRLAQIAYRDYSPSFLLTLNGEFVSEFSTKRDAIEYAEWRYNINK